MTKQQQFILVAYDISDDRRRTRLHQKLKDFGTPVQYSVFECLLDKEGLNRMKKVVRKVIHIRQDHVRIYRLCLTCRQKTEVFGGHEITSTPEVIVV